MNYLDPDMIEAWAHYQGEAGGKLSAYFQDEWGEILVVSHKRQRILTFDARNEQSSMDIKRPHYLQHDYTQAMMLGLIFAEAKSVVILGVGGGCLLRALHYAFPHLPIQAVELREKVVEAAEHFFGLPQAPHIDLIIGDAQDWLAQAAPASASHLFADLFLADGFVDYQLHRRFISHASRTLTEDGCLILNLHHQPNPSSDFVCLLRAYFPSLFWANVDSGNTLLFASRKTPVQVESIAWEEDVIELGERLDLSLDRMLSRLECL
ncbi:MAG: spermine synthase [Hahellaceae bacterium]|nr:spermine synthase [Hahellaceae bacterium]